MVFFFSEKWENQVFSMFSVYVFSFFQFFSVFSKHFSNHISIETFKFTVSDATTTPKADSAKTVSHSTTTNTTKTARGISKTSNISGESRWNANRVCATQKARNQRFATKKKLKPTRWALVSARTDIKARIATAATKISIWRGLYRSWRRNTATENGEVVVTLMIRKILIKFFGGNGQFTTIYASPKPGTTK